MKRLFVIRKEYVLPVRHDVLEYHSNRYECYESANRAMREEGMMRIDVYEYVDPNEWCDSYVPQI